MQLTKLRRSGREGERWHRKERKGGIAALKKEMRHRHEAKNKIKGGNKQTISIIRKVKQ